MSAAMQCQGIIVDEWIIMYADVTAVARSNITICPRPNSICWYVLDRDTTTLDKSFSGPQTYGGQSLNTYVSLF